MERFLDYFTPEYYQLELCIFSRKRLIQGIVTIDGMVKADFVKFHGVNLKIKSVSFCPHHCHTSEEQKFRECAYEYNGQEIKIPLTSEMRADLTKQAQVNYDDSLDDREMASFKIEFEAPINSNLQGCYVSSYEYEGKKHEIIATQFESHYARESFPCIDEPAAKAQFRLTLLTPEISPNDTVLANTPLINKDKNRYTFEPTPPMSTYLLAWVIGPLQSVSAVNKNGVQVSSYCALNQPTESLLFANQTAVRALEYYDELFGIKYPLAKLDQVALPDFEAGAMENWGLVTYRESCLLANPDASVDTKLNVAITVTHELAHQWFGNLVTMQWWDDLWLNESFATLMEYLATDKLHPEFNAWRDFFTGDCVAALRRDCLPGVQSVQQTVDDPAEIPTLFDAAIVYAKGARLMLMLYRLMGEKHFFLGLRHYFEQHQQKNATGDDLWAALQPYANFDVKDFMHAWISQPGYPMIEIKYPSHDMDKIDNYSSGDISIRTPNSSRDMCKQPADFTEHRFLIDGSTDDSEWLLPEVKDDMSGHYILSLSEADFSDRFEHFTKLSAEQKLRLLIDRSLLAKARRVSSASLLDLLPKFTTEDAAVWNILLDIINDLKIFFLSDFSMASASIPTPSFTKTPELSNTTDSPKNQYRHFLRHLIHGRIREIGLISQGSDTADTKQLRNILAVIARFARDEEIISDLVKQYRDNLSEIDPEMRSNILMAKMLADEDVAFQAFFEHYRSESNPDLKDELLCALASARAKEHISTMIQLLEQPEVVRPQDHLYLFVYLLRNPHARSLAIDWLYAHWDYVQKLTGDKSVEDYPRCLAGYINTRTNADKFYVFFRAHENTPILKRTLAMAKVGIESRLQLIEQESKLVHDKLKSLMKEYNGKS